MKYRTEIDGLRTFAIVPVVLYHAGVEQISGGYTGVDVFFVVSGYLVTKILHNQMIDGNYSFQEFYFRRARRLFPALFFMMSVITAACITLLSPDDLKQYGQSLAAASVFSSNILFWKESGYFDTAAELKPLLHTWSLAVEEQFYIILPIILWALFRWSRNHLAPILAALAIASFCASVWSVRHAPDTAFYLLPTRAWELLAGSLLALGLLPTLPKGWASEITAALGLVFIVVATFTFDATTRFPGETALIPVLGATLVIHASNGTLTGRLLSFKPLVWIGLISYSLYLWHWPLIMLATYANILPLSAGQTTAAVLLSFIAAGLSWRYIERPFRTPDFQAPMARLFAISAAVSIIFIAIGGSMHVYKGFAQRFPPSPYPPSEELLAGLQRSTCFVLNSEEWNQAQCVAQTSDRHLLIIGDSYAAQFSHYLRAHYPGAVTEFTSSACPAIFDYEHSIRPEECRKINERRRQLIDEDYTDIFVAAWWGLSRKSDMFEHLSATIQELQRTGARIFVYGPSPRFSASIPSIAHRQYLQGRETAELTAEVYNSLRQRFVTLPNVTLIDPVPAFCKDTVCSFREGRNLYFMDDGHLTAHGVKRATLLPEFQDLIGQGSVNQVSAAITQEGNSH